MKKIKTFLIILGLVFLSSFISLNIQTVKAQVVNTYLYLNGNVGIGTTNPTRKLSVVGTGELGAPADAGVKTASLLISSSGNPGANYGGGIELGAGGDGTYAQPYFSAIKGLLQNGNNSTAGDLAFYTRNNWADTALTERMRINYLGNVGIGTVNPGAKLDVYSDLRSSGPTSGWGGTYLGLFTGIGSLPTYPSNSYATLKTDGSYIAFSAGGAYSAYMGSGGGWTPVSSKLLKENFTSLDLSSVLNKIDNMPVMEWNYKSEGSSIKHIGPFAEDFYSLFGLNGTDNTHIDYTDSIGVSLAGVKALSQEVKDLQAQNADLEQRVKTLEQKMDSMSNK